MQLGLNLLSEQTRAVLGQAAQTLCPSRSVQRISDWLIRVSIMRTTLIMEEQAMDANPRRISSGKKSSGATGLCWFMGEDSLFSSHEANENLTTVT
jgi:hypothetical protein